MRELLPFVVMLGDPRWDACVNELLDPALPYVGEDTEFWEDPELRRLAIASGRDVEKGKKGKPAFDPWCTRLRLLQYGLPSGLVLVLDFGQRIRDGVAFDASPYSQLLPHLGQLQCSRKTSKIGWALSTEALVLRRHAHEFPEWFKGWHSDSYEAHVVDGVVERISLREDVELRDALLWSTRKARDGMLASQVIWAGVCAKKQRFTKDGMVPQVPLSHSFKDAAERVGVSLDKTEQQSNWGAPELTTSQLNYAATDVHRDSLIEVWKRLSELAIDEGVWESVKIECEAAPAFYECEWRGVPHDEAVCSDLIGAYERVSNDLQASVETALGCKISGDGSQATTAMALSKRVGRALYYWKLGDGDEAPTRDSFAMTMEEARPELPPKPKKPTGRPKPPVKPKKWGRVTEADYEQKVAYFGADLALYVEKVTEYESAVACWEEQAKAPKWRLIPRMGEQWLAPFDSDPVVSDLLEARSCQSTAEVLRKRQRNAWRHMGEDRLAVRCRYWQIAGSFDGATDAADGAGAGTGRSSSSKPLNNQNVTTLPLGKRRHDELMLPNVRSCVKPGTLMREGVGPVARSMLVADFSQAHMRFFAEMSQDPNLCADFRAGRDAHVRLAREFFRAQHAAPVPPMELDAFSSTEELLVFEKQKAQFEQAKRLHDFGQKSFDEWCEIYQTPKKLPDGSKNPGFRQDWLNLIKEPRGPAKNSNYCELNIGGPQKVRQIAETAPEPVHLPETIDVEVVQEGFDLEGNARHGETVIEARDPWDWLHEKWRSVYAVGHEWQRDSMRRAGRVKRQFPFCEGEYGACWSCDGKRRLFLLKEWNVPRWAESEDDGRYSVKGPDVLAGTMQMSEANALKIACANIMLDFDDNPLWRAFIFNIVHDEVNTEQDKAHEDAVARCVHERMQEGLRLAGLASIPTCAPDDSWEKLRVSCWADK